MNVAKGWALVCGVCFVAGSILEATKKPSPSIRPQVIAAAQQRYAAARAPYGYSPYSPHHGAPSAAPSRDHIQERLEAANRRAAQLEIEATSRAFENRAHQAMLDEMRRRREEDARRPGNPYH
jgi:hypothetical protein